MDETCVWWEGKFTEKTNQSQSVFSTLLTERTSAAYTIEALYPIYLHYPFVWCHSDVLARIVRRFELAGKSLVV